MGIIDLKKVSDRILRLFSSSMEWFNKLAQPVGIMADISIGNFQPIYEGMGKNEIETPLKGIFPRSKKLALMAFTLGTEISQMINRLFEDRDFAQGSMLDAIASQAAEKASREAEEIFSEVFFNKESLKISPVVLLYSPGYCGWHISGQKGLFDYLQPGEIGIRLNPQFLMTPLKSISGVLVAGESQIHFFENNFPFCGVCSHYSCIQRIKRIKQNDKEKKHGHSKSDLAIFTAGG
jgi:hypothetical protein